VVSLVVVQVLPCPEVMDVGGQFPLVWSVVPWLDVKLMGADQNRLLITKKSEKKFRQKIAH
jgi:hypothetical protein